MKTGYQAKDIAFAKSSVLVRNQNYKNMSKSIVEIISSCSVQKTARRNTKYSRNETIFKIGNHAKVIAFAESSLYVKN